MYTEMRWGEETPGIFVLCKGELPDIKKYPVCLQRGDGTTDIKQYCYTEIKGLKPFKEGKQTGFLKEGNLELAIEVRYLPIKLTGISLEKSGQSQYKTGDIFKPDGYILRAHYSDGRERKITDFIYPASTLQEGQAAVTLSYGCKHCDVPVIVSNSGKDAEPSLISEDMRGISSQEREEKIADKGIVRQLTGGRVRYIYRTWRFCPFYPSRSGLSESDISGHLSM